MKPADKDVMIIHALAVYPDWWGSKIAPYLFRNDEDCLIWQRSKGSHGYGQIHIPIPPPYMHIPNKSVMATLHRVAYLRHTGKPIPLPTLDHACHNAALTCPGGKCIHRLCANYMHLEPKTRQQNNVALGSKTPSALRAAQTTCQNDHPLIANTRRIGHRECQICEAEYRKVRTKLLLDARRKVGLTQKEYGKQFGWSRAAAEAILRMD